MGSRADDFERFLLHNYPDDWRRFTASNVTEDVKTAIMSRHAGHYQVWKDIPEWIKNNYGDRIPSDVLNGNEQVKEFIAKETHVNKEEEQQSNDILNFSVMALAAGYAVETVATLSNNRRARQQLLEAYGGQIPEELLEKWLETRRSDFEAIRKDFKERHPEKFLLHLVKSLDREQKRIDRGVAVDEALSKRKVHALEQELRDFVGNLSTRQAKLDMVDYLRGRPQQMALRHLAPDVLEKFTSLMSDQGIKIEPIQNQNIAERTLSATDSLTSSLKRDFSERAQIEEIMRKQTQYIAPNFARRARTATRRRENSRDIAMVRTNAGKSESSI